MSRLWQTDGRTDEQWKVVQYSVWAKSAISQSSVQAKVWTWKDCKFWVNLKSPQIAELSSNRNLIRPFRRDTVGFGGRQTPVREVPQILNCGKEIWVADFSWIGFQYLDDIRVGESVESALSAFAAIFLAHSTYFDNFRQKNAYFDISRQKRVLFNCFATKQCLGMLKMWG